MDLRLQNQSVLQELHPIPKVDETLAQLCGVTMFNKLDANITVGIMLDLESCHLTNFITLFGRYCFNKLPFGISSV